VPEDRLLADPPLLRLESEASHAYLSILLHVQTAQPPLASAEVRTCSWLWAAVVDMWRQACTFTLRAIRVLLPVAAVSDASVELLSWAVQAVDAASRLVRLCTANLTRFQHIKPDNGPEPAPAFTDANGGHVFDSLRR
jgi:hypothetical protein